MGQKSGPVKEPAEQGVKEIRRATRRQFSAEEKIRIVLSGLRCEDSIAELCRREGIVQNFYYRWSKEFLEAGKKRSRCGLILMRRACAPSQGVQRIRGRRAGFWRWLPSMTGRGGPRLPRSLDGFSETDGCS